MLGWVVFPQSRSGVEGFILSRRDASTGTNNAHAPLLKTLPYISLYHSVYPAHTHSASSTSSSFYPVRTRTAFIPPTMSAATITVPSVPSLPSTPSKKVCCDASPALI